MTKRHHAKMNSQHYAQKIKIWSYSTSVNLGLAHPSWVKWSTHICLFFNSFLIQVTFNFKLSMKTFTSIIFNPPSSKGLHNVFHLILSFLPFQMKSYLRSVINCYLGLVKTRIGGRSSTPSDILLQHFFSQWSKAPASPTLQKILYLFQLWVIIKLDLFFFFFF